VDQPVSGPKAVDVADEDLIDILAVLSFLASRWRYLVAVPMVGVVVGFGWSYTIPPTYVAKALLMPPSAQTSMGGMALQSLGALAGLAGGSGMKSPLEQYVALMQSMSVADKIIAAHNLQKVYGTRSRQETRESLAGSVTVAAGKKDGLISVEVEDTDPARAAAMANMFGDELSKMLTAINLDEARQRRAFYARQIQETKEKAEAAQAALGSAVINESTLKTEPRLATDVYASLKTQVSASEVRIRTMQQVMREDAPEMKMERMRLRALKEQLVQPGDAPASGVSSDYISKFRDFKYQQTLLELLAQQFELARLDEGRSLATVQLIDKAVAPERKAKPRRVIMGLATGLSAALLLMVFWSVQALRAQLMRHRQP
jgi:uncharacterized protein involved in exopolysaccharide biosynthesis